jgi:hypothetical protein
MKYRAWIAVGTCVAMLSSFGAPAIGEELTPEEIPPGRWGPPIPWGVVQVGPDGRSLELRWNVGCVTRAVATVKQARLSLRVTILAETTRVCSVSVIPSSTAQLRFAMFTTQVRFATPIAGRFITGLWGADSYSPADPVPRVLGLAPGDARLVIEGFQNRHRYDSATYRHAGKGLLRVIAQRPSPGAPWPRDGVVHLTISRPASRGR